jgi:hypothetical protein
MATNSVLPASTVKAYLRSQGAEAGRGKGFGARGRVSKEAIVTYLAGNPSAARKIAAEVGVSIPKRGTLTPERLSAVAALLPN